MFNKILTTAFVLAVIATALMCVNTTKADIVEDGLVHYWSFNNIVADIATDLVGDNDVEIIRGKTPAKLGGGRSDPQIVDSKTGMALEFDGDGDYAESKELMTITGSDPRTLSAWVKYNSLPDKNHTVVGWGWEGETPQGANPVLFSLNTAAKNIGVWGATTAFIIKSKPLAPDTWYHFTATYDGGKPMTGLKIYINGNSEEFEDATGTNQPFDTAKTKLVIGKKMWNFADRAWFNGIVDEVAIYDRALSEEEVEQNFVATGYAV